MIVRNWMEPNPQVVTGDTLLSEAKRILTEKNLHALPVIEDGRLRGIITRAHCLRAAHFVARTQNPDEYHFFANRLKVKDIMVRNPATVEATETMENALQKGRELGVAQFPVMEDGQVVGVITANEVFTLAAHFLGAWERRSGVALGPMPLQPGTIGRIADIASAAGASVHAIYPIGKAEPGAHKANCKKKIIVRFHAPNVHAVIDALVAAGYRVIESVEAAHQPLPN